MNDQVEALKPLPRELVEGEILDWGAFERLIAREVDEEIAVGDFVVSGGELPALMVILSPTGTVQVV